MTVKRSKNDGYMLRMPDGMRDRIRASAEENNRSMNAEIVGRLEHSFGGWPWVVMPADLVERALAGTPEERAAYETNLSVFAAQLAEKHFPKTGERQAAIEDVWSEIIADMDNILEPEKKRLTEDMKTVVRELIRRGVIEG